MVLRLCLLLTILLSYSTPRAHAEDGAVMPAKADFADLRLTGSVTVKQVLDPLRLQLTDGRIVQLSGVDVPGMDPHEPGDIAVAAAYFLKDLYEGKPCRLYQTKDAQTGRVNRMGYVLGHLERQDGDVWAQGALLANGLARVYPGERTPEMASAMMAIEAEARQAKRGLWADPAQGILTPETASNALHSMAIVEGTVRAAAVANNRIYLNFGPDWRTDFTVGIEPDVRKRFNALGVNPMGFARKTLRVRGWVEDYNGPYIRLTNPAWVEILNNAQD